MMPPKISINAFVAARFVAWKSLCLCTRLLGRPYLSGWAFVSGSHLRRILFPVSKWPTRTKRLWSRAPAFFIVCMAFYDAVAIKWQNKKRRTFTDHTDWHRTRPHKARSFCLRRILRLTMTPFQIEWNWTASTDFLFLFFRFRNRFLRKNSNLLNKTVQILSLHNKRSIKINKRRTKWMAGWSVRDKYVKSKRYWSDGSSSDLPTRFKICPVLMYLWVAKVFRQ